MKAIDKINAYIEEMGIKKKWLASKLNVTTNHLYILLRGESPLTEDNLEVINNLWPGVTFTSDEQNQLINNQLK